MASDETPRGDLAEQFYAHLRAGSLQLQRCASCGRWRHVPRILCPACASDQWSWEPVAGTGSVYTWTTTHRAMHPDFTDVPYTIAVIELDEGPRMLAPLVGLDDTPPHVGMRVTVDSVAIDKTDASNLRRIPAFRPQPR